MVTFKLSLSFVLWMMYIIAVAIITILLSSCCCLSPAVDRVLVPVQHVAVGSARRPLHWSMCLLAHVFAGTWIDEPKSTRCQKNTEALVKGINSSSN